MVEDVRSLSNIFVSQIASTPTVMPFECTGSLRSANLGAWALGAWIGYRLSVGYTVMLAILPLQLERGGLCSTAGNLLPT